MTSLIEMCLKGGSAIDAAKYLSELKKLNPSFKEIYYLEGFLFEL